MAEPTTAIISYIKASYYFIQKVVPGLWNFFKRPNFSVDIKRQAVVFISSDNKEYLHDYFCLVIENNSKEIIYLNIARLYINNESYFCILQDDQHFLRLNPQSKNTWKKCENEIYELFSKNWFEINQNGHNFEIKPFQKIVFPMKLIKNSSHTITSVKKQSKLFGSSFKISVTLESNKKTYEYGLNRRKIYEQYINYLAYLKLDK